MSENNINTTQRLDEYIKEIGITRKFLAKKIGMTENVMNRKMNHHDFTKDEWDKAVTMAQAIDDLGKDNGLNVNDLARLDKRVSAVWVMIRQVDDTVLLPALDYLMNELVQDLRSL